MQSKFWIPLAIGVAQIQQCGFIELRDDAQGRWRHMVAVVLGRRCELLSDHRDAASRSRRASSDLLATSSTGRFDCRSIRTTCSSVEVGPTLTSTTNSTASASSTAISACCATDRSMPRASGSQPPVSTTVKRRPLHSAL